ncbi:MAG: M1 family metallopeptidase [Bacteroidota bacterium]
MIRYILLLTSICLMFSGFNNAYTQNISAESYNSTTNTNYWKNKTPNKDYWQQDVYYKIEAEIDEKTDILSGNEELIYVNNSPDELNELYFHLYQNAFQPDSYLDKLNKGNGNTSRFGIKYQSQKKGIEVSSVSINGNPVQWEIDNTIMKIKLPNSLKSNGTCKINISFKTYFDITAPWGRLRVYDSWGSKHYNGAHWYPRISVYDRRFGWTKDQHLGHEFYGDFGTYDVSLTFSSNQIVEATGDLINENEVLPSDLKQKLNLKNFANKPFGEKPSVIIPYDSTKRKTWHYIASNVHDFAFVADPNYRIDETVWNGIKCVAIANESTASKWQTASQITADIVKYYSETIGMYQYPKMIVADAQSGMEYPMLTMNSGIDPNYTYIFAHEIGHNWFFGMVGSNETYSAMLDEGFTQYLTVSALEKLSKERTINEPNPSKYIDKYEKKYSIRDLYSYLPYIENANKEGGVQLNTHSDYFLTKQAYGSVYRQTYYKGSTMLFNLKYVLGDSLFNKAMQNYFSQWSFCHPYIEDFRNSIIQSTNVDLNWFFDEWINTNKTIDYKVGNVKHIAKDTFNIEFIRKGLSQMPIEFTVISKNDVRYNYIIPNTNFVKSTSSIILPSWTGWNNLNKEYHAKVVIPDGIKDIIIDTAFLMADANMINNSKKLNIDYNFDHGLIEKSNWRAYEINARPDLWWNSIDGLKLGFNVSGNFMKQKNCFDMSVWANSGFLVSEKQSIGHDNFSYNLNYQTALNKLGSNANFVLNARDLDGLSLYKIGIDKSIENSKFSIFFKSMHRNIIEDYRYLLYPTEWSYDNIKGLYGNEYGKVLYNNTININWLFRIENKKNINQLNLSMRSSVFTEDFNFSCFSFEYKNTTKIDEFMLKTRLFGQLGLGNKWATESSLYLAGGNSEEMMENKYVRSDGFVNESWLGYDIQTNHFQYGGGLNLRGYSGYYVAEPDNYGNIESVYRGNTGFAVNSELEFDEYINPIPKKLRNTLGFNSYLFGDIGIINKNKAWENISFARFRADAGIGAALTIKKWGNIQKAEPLTIRFDAPIWLNRIPAVDKDYLMYRWVISISRAF